MHKLHSSYTRKIANSVSSKMEVPTSTREKQQKGRAALPVLISADCKNNQPCAASLTDIAFFRWLGFWLEQVGNFIVLFSGLFAVIERDSISPGLAGLSISYALQVESQIQQLSCKPYLFFKVIHHHKLLNFLEIVSCWKHQCVFGPKEQVPYGFQVTGALNMFVRMTCDLETYVVAAERVKEYTDCPQEVVG